MRSMLYNIFRSQCWRISCARGFPQAAALQPEDFEATYNHALALQELASHTANQADEPLRLLQQVCPKWQFLLAACWGSGWWLCGIRLQATHGMTHSGSAHHTGVNSSRFGSIRPGRHCHLNNAGRHVRLLDRLRSTWAYDLSTLQRPAMVCPSVTGALWPGVRQLRGGARAAARLTRGAVQLGRGAQRHGPPAQSRQPGRQLRPPAGRHGQVRAVAEVQPQQSAGAAYLRHTNLSLKRHGPLTRSCVACTACDI